MERQQESPVSERRSTNGRDDENRRAEVTTTVDISRATDAVRQVRRSGAVQTTMRPNTEAEAYPLWNSQPVEVAEERRDVFRAPRGEHKSGGSVEGRLKSVREVTRDADQQLSIGGGRGQWLGGTMARAEHEPIMGVWVQSAQRGPGAEPLVRVRGAKPP